MSGIQAQTAADVSCWLPQDREYSTDQMMNKEYITAMFKYISYLGISQWCQALVAPAGRRWIRIPRFIKMASPCVSILLWFTLCRLISLMSSSMAMFTFHVPRPHIHFRYIVRENSESRYVRVWNDRGPYIDHRIILVLGVFGWFRQCREFLNQGLKQISLLSYIHFSVFNRHYLQINSLEERKLKMVNLNETLSKQTTYVVSIHMLRKIYQHYCESVETYPYSKEMSQDCVLKSQC